MVTTEVKNNNLAQIRWSCRRGMLELDKILGGFFDLNYLHLPLNRQLQFTALLKESDQSLYDWLVVGVNLPLNAALQDFILLIRYFNNKSILTNLSCGLD